MSSPIIDAHHHIWRKIDLPWLIGPMLPRIFGPYEPIRRDYPITEYLADHCRDRYGKIGLRTGELGARARRGRGGLGAADGGRVGWPHAIVGYADLLAEDARPAFDRLTRCPLLRGVRMQLHWHDNEQYRFARKPDVADNPTFRKNIAVLADYDLSFDLQVFSGQMQGAARLARDFPRTTFILQHAGMLEDLSEGGRISWRSGMRALAAQPNVVSKLSGLGTFIHRNDPQHISWIVGETVALFGARRCLFGSNFPVEKLWTDYRSLLAAYREAIAGFDEAEQRAILHDTAARVYRIG